MGWCLDQLNQSGSQGRVHNNFRAVHPHFGNAVVRNDPPEKTPAAHHGHRHAVLFSDFRQTNLQLSEIEGHGAQTSFFVTSAGITSKAAVLLDGTNFSVFFQDAKQGFTRKPQHEFQLPDRPALVCPAKLGRKAESLLLMTSDGVTELDFTTRTNPPTRQQIIQQKTIIPVKLDGMQAAAMPFSAKTGTNWPLLLFACRRRPAGVATSTTNGVWRRPSQMPWIIISKPPVWGSGYPVVCHQPVPRGRQRRWTETI